MTPGIASSEYAERCAESCVRAWPNASTNRAHCAGKLRSQTFYLTDRWLSSQRRHSRICRTTCRFHVRVHENIANAVLEGCTYAPPLPAQTTKMSTCSTCAGFTSTPRFWLASSLHRKLRHGGTSL